MRIVDCKYKYGLETGERWTLEEDDALRDWWEYHDKDAKLEFDDLQKDLPRHSLLAI